MKPSINEKRVLFNVKTKVFVRHSLCHAMDIYGEKYGSAEER